MLTDTRPLAAQARTPFNFDEGVERYLDYLRSVGYSPSTLRKRRKMIGAFAQWARSSNLAMDLVKDSDIGAFASCLDFLCQIQGGVYSICIATPVQIFSRTRLDRGASHAAN
jgi:hypothetical protein